MKPHFVDAILSALLPTGRGVDACGCAKQDDHLPGEHNRYRHT